MLIKFHEVDLKSPLQPVYVDEKYHRLFLIVRWGYLPIELVRLQVDPCQRTYSPEQLQAAILENLGWKLWELSLSGELQRLEQVPDGSLPAISVVVCTRDRPLSLERCLESLKTLDYPNYEVVVVDNCSRDSGVAGVVKSLGFRYVRENRPGLDWARNRGFIEAQHDLIAYIDDDALATPGWLRGVALGFRNPGVMAVTGMVLPAEIETQAQDDFERYGGMSKGFVGYTIRWDALDGKSRFWASNWGVGANMAFRRVLFTAIGDFDVGLDVGTPTNGGGDIEFFYRTVSAGHILHYEPAAMIYHVHRRDRESLLRQIYNNGRAFAAYLLTISRNEHTPKPAVIWFALRWWIWEWLLRRVFQSMIKRDRETLRLALIELRGCLSAPGAFSAARRTAAQQLSLDYRSYHGNPEKQAVEWTRLHDRSR
jgi:glycosyltransferase involved in cell wall biosynthesis